MDQEDVNYEDIIAAPAPANWGTVPIQPYSEIRLMHTALSVYLQLNPTEAAQALSDLKDRLLIVTDTFQPRSLYIPALASFPTMSQADKLQLFNKIVANLSKNQLTKLNLDMLSIRSDDLTQFSILRAKSLSPLASDDGMCCYLSQAIYLAKSEVHFSGLTETFAAFSSDGQWSDAIREIESVAKNRDNHPPPTRLECFEAPFDYEDWSSTISIMAPALFPPTPQEPITYHQVNLLSFIFC